MPVTPKLTQEPPMSVIPKLKASLAELVAGDMVVEIKRSSYTVKTVDRVTKLWIIVENIKFKKNSGDLLADVSRFDQKQISVNADNLKVAFRQRLEKSLFKEWNVICKDIKKLSNLAKEAEAFLREIGEWTDD